MLVVAGIDVSKAMLDVAITEGPVYRFANSGPGLRRLLQHMACAGPHRRCAWPPAGRNGCW